ncbi:PH domain-containing protein [uncultured Negativibacillus sp.]|uniref:PH domain-containing protein n=1 Tax=uncultured Negativibacillus sp. TaxID=1980696 RepID=UPI0025F3781B|nr:PH domain-containing protein [uncultured Negativibacillus sp.]
MGKKDSVHLLWSDRSRILGLPITFTKYGISEDRIFCEKGLLNMKFEEILLYRVRDISMKITLGQRIFGVGSILLQSSDKTAPVLEIKNIKNPREVKEMIHEQVEEVKVQRRMRFGEVLEDPADDEAYQSFE